MTAVKYDAPWIFNPDGTIGYDSQATTSGVWFRDIDTIRLDGGTQPRGHINHEVVQRYADALDAGAHFPPLTVFFDGENYWLADGFHRTAAYRMRSITSVPVQYVSGSLREAQWFSFSVNAAHGYPRNDTDVEKILARIFLDPEWGGKPIREISDHVSVSKSWVWEVRERVLYKADVRKRDRSPTLSGTGQSGSASIEIQPREQLPVPDEQYDREDAIAAAPPPKMEGNAPDYVLRSFPAEHSAAGSRIRELVNRLYRELTLPPAHAARAAPGDPNDYRREVSAVLRWLSRLEEELTP